MTSLPRPAWPGGPIPPSGAVEAGTIRYEREERRQPRRIVQITTVGPMLYALCDDGTVWSRWPKTDWQPEPAIPQRQLAED